MRKKNELWLQLRENSNFLLMKRKFEFGMWTDSFVLSNAMHSTRKTSLHGRNYTTKFELSRKINLWEIGEKNLIQEFFKLSRNSDYPYIRIKQDPPVPGTPMTRHYRPFGDIDLLQKFSGQPHQMPPPSECGILSHDNHPSCDQVMSRGVLGLGAQGQEGGPRAGGFLG